MGFSAYVGGRVYQFTLFAGRGNNNPGNANMGNGYFDSSLSGGKWSLFYGSISGQPIPGATLQRIVQADYSSTSIAIAFYGDVRAHVSGLRLYINGVVYNPADGQNWNYYPTFPGTATMYTTDQIGTSVIANGGTYTIQLRR